MNHQQMHSGENGDVGGNGQAAQTSEAQKTSHEEDMQEMFIHQVM